MCKHTTHAAIGEAFNRVFIATLSLNSLESFAKHRERNYQNAFFVFLQLDMLKKEKKERNLFKKNRNT